MSKSLQHIETYLKLDNTTVDISQADTLLTALQEDIASGNIKKSDKYAKEITAIQSSLVRLVHSLQKIAFKYGTVDAQIKVEISKASKAKYTELLKQNGLGFLPIVVGAAAGKLIEAGVTKLFSKKNTAELGTTDFEITKSDALALGIVGYSGLGFVNPTQAFKKVNREILVHIQKGDLIWRKPWRDGYRVKGTTYGPQNYETQMPYRGYNAWLINFINFGLKENNEYFLTAKQVHERGGKIRKGATQYPVSAFIKGEKTKKLKSGKEVVEEYAGWVHYIVYAINHCEGIKPIVRKKTGVASERPDEIIADAETLISRMPKAPPIKHGGNRAYYSLTTDYVQMPVKKAFPDKKKYYSVLFHELVHSTGNKRRIGRDMSGQKGNKAYAFEELIAELGAAYLCAVVDIDYHTLQNSAAYLKSWGKSLTIEIQNDTQFLFRAVYAASKAAKYIIGETLNKVGFIKPAAEQSTVKKPAKKKKQAAVKKKTDPIIEVIKEVFPKASIVEIQSMPQIGKNVYDKKGKSEITKVHRPVKGSPYYGVERFLIDIKRENGKTAINMPYSIFTLKPQGQLKLELTGLGKPGVMSITAARTASFELIGLDGLWLKLIGEACNPTSFFIYGTGGSGKSTLTMLFAYYMANKGNKVAYIAGEQYNTPVFKNMLIRLDIQENANFTIVKDRAFINPSEFNIIVIDSKDSLHYELDDFISDKKKYPKQSFLILSQGTKGGSFTGTEKWRNEVDTMIVCENMTAYTNRDKNRWGGSAEIPILDFNTNRNKK